MKEFEEKKKKANVTIEKYNYNFHSSGKWEKQFKKNKKKRRDYNNIKGKKEKNIGNTKGEKKNCKRKTGKNIHKSKIKSII